MICGASGSGKSAILERLEQTGLTSIQSYTTRPPRYPGEKGHIFIPNEPIESIKRKYPVRVAETIFDGHFYFATYQQAVAADLYVIDPDGIGEFRKRRRGRPYRVIFIDCPADIAMERMRFRGASREEALRRIAHDKEIFAPAKQQAHLVVQNINLDASVQTILTFIKREEKC